MPNNVTLKDATDVLNQAGKNYKEFKKRQGKFYLNTANQQEEARKAYLENHVHIFDTYCSLKTENAPLGLNRDAIELARDIIRAFPESRIAEKITAVLPLREVPIVDPASSNKKKELGIDIRGRLRENYGKRQQNLVIRSNEEGTSKFEEAERTQEEKNLTEGLTRGQIRGVRNICFWLDNNTKEHHNFVDSIASRSPRERLLIFYIVEKEKQHNVTLQDVFSSQLYVPTPRTFADKVKHHGWRKGGKVNWDKLSDAAVTAFGFREMLGVIGAGTNLTAPLDKKDEEPGGMRESSGGMRESSGGMRESSGGMRESLGGMREKDESDISLDRIPIVKDINTQLDAINLSAREIMKLMKKPETTRDQIQPLLDKLQTDITDLQTYTEKNFDEDLLLGEVNTVLPGKEGFVKETNKVTGKISSYMGLLRQVAGVGSSFMADAKAEKIDFWGGSQFSSGFTTSGLILDVPMVLFSFLNGYIQLTGLIKSFSASTTSEVWSQALGLSSNVLGALKSTAAATQTGASLFKDASWGSAGTSATATTIKTSIAIAGAGIGTLGAMVGGYNIINAGSRRSDLTAAEESIETAKNADKKKVTSERQKQKQAGTDEIIMNAIAANRKKQKQKQWSAGMQTVSSSLTAASGYLTLAAGASFGVTGIIALGLSGLAFVTSITKIIYDKKSKKHEINAVVDRYLGIEGMTNDYIQQKVMHMSAKDAQRWKKKHGNDSDIREHLREEAINQIGYTSKVKLYNEIMYQYATVLYQELFYRGGNRNDKVKNSDVYGENGAIKDQRRHAYLRLLHSLGLDVKFGGLNSEPSPDVKTIYKKLIG